MSGRWGAVSVGSLSCYGVVLLLFLGSLRVLSADSLRAQLPPPWLHSGTSRELATPTLKTSSPRDRTQGAAIFRAPGDADLKAWEEV